jgi:hypothetical protein
MNLALEVLWLIPDVGTVSLSSTVNKQSTSVKPLPEGTHLYIFEYGHSCLVPTSMVTNMVGWFIEKTASVLNDNTAQKQIRFYLQMLRE